MAGAGGIPSAAEGYKPCAAMVSTQCIFAAMTLWVKVAFGQGMSPMVFVVYRQAVATIVLAPIAIIANRARLKELRLGIKGFFLVFLAALVGATANQNLCYQGLHLGTSSLATTMTNLIPAITFVMAVAARALSCANRTWTLCACRPGPASSPPCSPRRSPCSCCRTAARGRSTRASSSPATSSLYVGTTWFQKLHIKIELTAADVSRTTTMQGVFGSGVVFCLQSWCVSVRGPLYSAMFTPLCTVVTTALSAAVLHEELHIGSLVGAAAIVAGLYIVLWGKAEDARTGRTRARGKDCAKAADSLDPHRHYSGLDLENTLDAPLMAGTGRADRPN